MSATLIAALEKLERQVAAMAGAVKKQDPEAIKGAAEAGARHGTAGLGNLAYDLKQAVTRLNILHSIAEKASESAQDARQAIRWGKVALIALLLILGLLCGFTAGVFTIKSGLIIRTGWGCSLLGGEVAHYQDGTKACWARFE